MTNNTLQKDLVCLKNSMKKKFVNKFRNMFDRLNESDSDIEEILIIDDSKHIVEEIRLEYDYNKKCNNNLVDDYDYERDYKDELNDAFDDTSRKNLLIIVEAKLDLLLESLTPTKYLSE